MLSEDNVSCDSDKLNKFSCLRESKETSYRICASGLAVALSVHAPRQTQEPPMTTSLPTTPRRSTTAAMQRRLLCRHFLAVAAVIAMASSLAAALWLGGGPMAAQGWEAVSWMAGILTAIALLAGVLRWAWRQRGASGVQPMRAEPGDPDRLGSPPSIPAEGAIRAEIQAGGASVQIVAISGGTSRAEGGRTSSP